MSRLPRMVLLGIPHHLRPCMAMWRTQMAHPH